MNVEFSINEKRVTDLFLELISYNSPPRHEREMRDLVCLKLESLGYECEFDDAGERVGGDCGNLFAFKKGNTPEAPAILFSAHMDTVEPTEGLIPVIDGDIIRSGGDTILGADDKSGIASIIEAVRVLDEQDLAHGDIQIIITICEEIGLLGSSVMDPSRIRAQYGYVVDTGPPVGAFTIQAPSHDTFEVIVRGKSAHAGTHPELGVSAILAASKAIASMKLGRIDHETTANIGVFHGGSATNIITEEVVIKGEARSLNPDKLNAQRESMFAAFENAAKEVGATVEIKLEHNYQTYRIAEDAPVLKLARRGAEIAGLEYLTRPGGGGSDANNFNRYDTSSVVVGCGMQNAHQHSEYILVSDIVKTARVLVGIALASVESAAGTVDD